MAEKKVKTEKVKTEKVRKKTKSASNGNASHKVAAEKLELLVTIVGRNKADFFVDLLQSLEVNMQMTVFGHGTANEKMLVYLGLSDTEKAVIFSVIKEKKVNDAVALLDEKFHTIKDGKGVAFTVPLTSVIGTLIYRFLSNNRMSVKEEK